MRLLPVALLVVMVAGCTGSPGAQPVAEEDPAAGYVLASRPTNAQRWDPCLGFAGVADLTGATAPGTAGQTKAFTVADAAAHLQVPEGVSAIVLDLWWEGGPATGIRARAEGPGGAFAVSESRMTASSDDPIRLRFDAPAAGAWEWTGVAEPVAAGVVLHYNEGLYYVPPEDVGFGCNLAGAAPEPVSGGKA